MTEQTDPSAARSRSVLLKILINGTIWSLLGVILAVVFFYWTQYRNPFDFEITIDDEVNLVQVHDRIADLAIRYKNEDILNTSRVLKVLRITLRNLGQTILQNQYDQSEQFGLVFKDAEVLDATVMDSNAEYLRTHLLPKTSSKAALSSGNSQGSPMQVGALRLEKAIFEKGKFATLKVFLLQQRDEPVIALASGKIANIDSLIVRRSLPGQRKQAIPIAPIATFVAVYAGTIAAIITFSRYISIRTRGFRNRKAREFLKTHKNLTLEQKAIVQVYQQRWSRLLSDVVRHLGAGDEPLDLQAFFDRAVLRVKSTPRKVVISSWLLLTIESASVPREVFIRDGTVIRFDPENEKFIREFFATVGLIRKGVESPTPPHLESAGGAPEAN